MRARSSALLLVGGSAVCGGEWLYPGKEGDGGFMEPRVVLVGIVDGEEDRASSGLPGRC